MRFLIAGLILAIVLPAAEASPKGQCKDRCGSMYQFCLKRARTKEGRKLCKADRKACKHQCRG
jgi:hypothetical protein